MLDSAFLAAFLLTLGAGLASVIGAALIFVKGANRPGFLGFALGASAGAMIFISLVEIVPKSFEGIETLMDPRSAAVFGMVAFLFGMGGIALVDRALPQQAFSADFNRNRVALKRTGIMVAVAVAVHNLPEGLGTFLIAYQDVAVGAVFALAIALHNIPEGVAIAVPLKIATGKRGYAFGAAALAGLAEPIGGLIGFLILRPYLNEGVLGFVLAAIAGLMTYIAIESLMPAARDMRRASIASAGLVTGVAVMGLSLALLTTTS
jgi:zinc transporter, ZIP family